MNLTKGDAVIYTGLPSGTLLNGSTYLLEGIEGDMAVLHRHGECSIEDIYPLRDFNGNDEIHHTYYEDMIAGTWTLPSDRNYINLQGLVKLYTEERLMEVSLDDIDGISLDLPERMRGENCACCNGERFITADTKKPLILFVGLENPMGRKYRVMDGKHRIAKLRWCGKDTAMAYVLHIDEVLPYFN